MPKTVAMSRSEERTTIFSSSTRHASFTTGKKIISTMSWSDTTTGCHTFKTRRRKIEGFFFVFFGGKGLWFQPECMAALRHTQPLSHPPTFPLGMMLANLRAFSTNSRISGSGFCLRLLSYW